MNRRRISLALACLIWASLALSAKIAAAQTQLGTVEAFTKATLPRPGTPGRIVRLTDDIRGLWVDTGTTWRSLTNTANVLDFGAVPDDDRDDSQAFQSAINAAAGIQVQIPPGTYRIARTLISQTTAGNEEGLKLSGAGRFRVTLDNRVTNGPLLSLRTDGSSGTRQKHVVIEGLTIRGGSPGPANSDGIRILNAWHVRIADIAITGLSGNAFVIDGPGGDPEASVSVDIRNVDFSQNLGYALKVVNDVPPRNNLLSYLSVEDSRMLSNRGGGILYDGLTATIRRTSIAYNGGTGGFFAPYGAHGIQNLAIEFCEFDTNYPTNIRIEAGYGISIVDTQFTGNPGANSSGNTLKGVVLGVDKGTTVGQVTLARNRVRVDPSFKPYVQYELNNAQSGEISIVDTFWQQFDPRTQTKYANNVISPIIIRENNKYVTTSHFSGLVTDGPLTLGSSAKVENILFGGVELGGSGTANVRFPVALADATYHVSLTGQANETLWITNKTPSGFTINSSNPRSRTSVDWLLLR